jgi:hypothetical protein
LASFIERPPKFRPNRIGFAVAAAPKRSIALASLT